MDALTAAHILKSEPRTTGRQDEAVATLRAIGHTRVLHGAYDRHTDSWPIVSVDRRPRPDKPLTLYRYATPASAHGLFWAATRAACLGHTGPVKGGRMYVRDFDPHEIVAALYLRRRGVAVPTGEFIATP